MSPERARPAVRAFSTTRHARRAVTPGYLSLAEREAAASLVNSLREGSRLALAKLLTQVENDTPVGRAAQSLLFKDTGRAHLIGITGSPGTGKSSLVNRIAQYYRRPPAGQPLKVAVIAVDPSSPFSGGAVLGDRVRMRDLSGDPGVFIRSMAARGALGGLSHTTAAAVQVLDAAGFDVVLIETVGAGQSEVDIARVAHTTLVVEAPGLGDDIQAIKAGILEIADILVVNKADRPGVENTERALRNMLEMAHPQRSIYHRAGRDELVGEVSLAHHHRPSLSMAAGETPEELEPTWMPRVIRTIATEGVGMEELGKVLADHREYLLSSGEWAYREQLRIQSELDALLRDTLVSRWRASVTERDIRRALDELLHRRITPFEAVERLTGGPPFTGSLRTQE